MPLSIFMRRLLSFHRASWGVPSGGSSGMLFKKVRPILTRTLSHAVWLTRAYARQKKEESDSEYEEESESDESEESSGSEQESEGVWCLCVAHAFTPGA